jgi:hypothetical protein
MPICISPFSFRTARLAPPQVNQVKYQANSGIGLEGESKNRPLLCIASNMNETCTYKVGKVSRYSIQSQDKCAKQTDRTQVLCNGLNNTYVHSPIPN